ncbi:hypothetical protein QF015_004295 [Paenarthrobacter sp. TE4293]|uniref:hypothetical protein n=1 Tax=Paenarthrobacter sp. TE4293 TaxID=3381695 RepID=UPI003D1D57ED
MLLTGKYFVAWVEHGRQSVDVCDHAIQADLNTGFDARYPCPAQPDNPEAVVGLAHSTGAARRSGAGPQVIDHHSGEERLLAGWLVRDRLYEAGAFGPSPDRKIMDSLRPGLPAGHASLARRVSQSA